MRAEELPEDYVPWEGPESTLFTKAIRNVLVRGAPAPLKSSVAALLADQVWWQERPSRNWASFISGDDGILK